MPVPFYLSARRPTPALHTDAAGAAPEPGRDFWRWFCANDGCRSQRLPAAPVKATVGRHLVYPPHYHGVVAADDIPRYTTRKLGCESGKDVVS
jgi:hypothetical protein